MKSFLQYAIEDKRKWFNVPTRELGKNNDITQNIYDLITKTYASVGGYPDFSSPKDLPSDFTKWLAVDVDDDPDVDATTFSKKGPGGEKLGGIAFDGSAAAKKVMLNKVAKMLKTKGNYGEMSDAPSHIMITKYSVPVVTDEDKVRQLLVGKKLEWVGEHPGKKYPGSDGWYYRNLIGKRKLKILLGRPR